MYFHFLKLINRIFYYRDLEDPKHPIYTVDAHNEIINTIDGFGGTAIGCGAPEIVTGSRDGV